jgi:TRAP transporter TAXI family solute receptor
MHWTLSVILWVGLGLGLLSQTSLSVEDTSTRAFRERINQGTVAIVSGGVTGTYIRIASDLSNVLDDGDSLRILAILGKGSIQNIDDMLYLKGVDIGIVQSDALTFVEREGRHPTIDQRIRYITKLYNEEFHLLARRDIPDVEALNGRKVNFGVQGSGTYMTSSIIFETLGVEVEPVSHDQALALEKVKSGEIDAMVYVAGKPVTLFSNLSTMDRLHLLPIEYTPDILETYLPSRFTEDDYPALVTGSTPVQTVAVGAVMAVYNWKPGTSRYRKVSHFVERFFDRFDEFKKPPRHPKWQEVSLTATVPGWSRFGPAQTWLQRNAMDDQQGGDLRAAFDTFLQGRNAGGAQPSKPLSDGEKNQLFEQFLRWYNTQDQ